MNTKIRDAGRHHGRHFDVADTLLCFTAYPLSITLTACSNKSVLNSL
jgi:hypothetical protein